MREKTFGGMHYPAAFESNAYTKFTTRNRTIEPQNPRFFAELFNRHNRQWVRSKWFQLYLHARRALVELRKIDAPALLFFHDFEPHFELFEPAS